MSFQPPIQGFPVLAVPLPRLVTPRPAEPYHPPGANPNSFFTSSNAIQPHHAKAEQAIVLADHFYKATLGKIGTDEAATKQSLEAAYQQDVQVEFEQAVLQLARKQGKNATGIEDILEQELAGNIFKKAVLKAPLTECQDFWRQGQATYRATPWDYRVRGMWGSLEHFAHVIKSHPAISLTAMAGVTAVGHFKPVVGAVSGAAIMGTSAVATAANEVKALKYQKMGPEKAKHYQKSGENLTAFLLTLVGVEGIQKGLVSGYKAGKASANLAPKNVVLRKPYQAWQGLMHKASSHEKMDYRQFAMFVLGLLDDSLLPFNWVAEKMKKGKTVSGAH